MNEKQIQVNAEGDAPVYMVLSIKELRSLLKRAQEARVVRDDVDFSDVLHMVIGIGKVPTSDPEQIEHIIRIALDGLRYRPDR